MLREKSSNRRKNIKASSTMDFFLLIRVLRKKSSKRRQNINASSTIDFFLHIRADEAVFLQNMSCALA
jgi:alpha-D-ribose 1-methylphosphonate 5-triphosphate synthase subunit PhnG